MNKIAILLVAGLAALSTANYNNGTKANAANSTNNAANNSQIQETMVLGKLYFVNLKEGEQPIMTALSLFGNRCGSESFNHKPYAAEGIRSVFELDEWIEFYPKANAESGIKVMVFKHQEDQGIYLKNSLNDKTPGYIQELDLSKDPEGDETSLWGSFYLQNKVFATMLTHFFKPNEIYEKSDSELEKLMSQSL